MPETKYTPIIPKRHRIAKAWTEDRVCLLLELYFSDISIPRIARNLEISESSVRAKIWKLCTGYRSSHGRERCWTEAERHVIPRGRPWTERERHAVALATANELTVAQIVFLLNRDATDIVEFMNGGSIINQRQTTSRPTLL